MGFEGQNFDDPESQRLPRPHRFGQGTCAARRRAFLSECCRLELCLHQASKLRTLTLSLGRVGLKGPERVFCNGYSLPGLCVRPSRKREGVCWGLRQPELLPGSEAT